MENSNKVPNPERQQQVFEQASLLYGVFFNNEKYVEALHTMFLACAQEQLLKEETIAAYINLRHFLRDTEVLFNPKTTNNG